MEEKNSNYKLHNSKLSVQELEENSIFLFNLFIKLMEEFKKHYKLLPYNTYTVTEIDKIMKDAEKESLHISNYLTDVMNWNEIYLTSVGKMVGVCQEFAFPNDEKMSLKFLLYFTIESDSSDMMNERQNIFKLLPFSRGKHEYDMESFIFFFYRLYGILQTYIGVTIAFFIFLKDDITKESNFSEQNVKRLMKKYLIDDENSKNDDEYHALEYLNLIEDKLKEIINNYTIENNLVKFLKKLVEYFLKIKVNEDFQEDDLYNVIKNSGNNPEEIIDINKFDFNDFLNNFPEFYSPFRNFYQMITGRFLDAEPKSIKELFLKIIQ